MNKEEIISENEQERDIKEKRRRSRSERSHSRCFGHPNSIINQQLESSKEDTDSEGSPKETINVQKLISEEAMFIGKQLNYDPKEENKAKIFQKDAKILENFRLVNHEETEKNIIKTEPIEETKQDSHEASKESMDNLLPEARIKAVEDIDIFRNNNQGSTPSKEENSQSFSQETQKEESKSNVEREGEGDIFDKITPLEITSFGDKPFRISKNYSEKNRENL